MPGMKLVGLVTLLLLAACKPRYPTCDPNAAVCPACTKCTHCKICFKEGGSCSVCPGRPLNLKRGID